MPPPLRQAARGEGAAAPRVDRGDGVDGALAPHASSSATSKKALGLWEPRSSRPWEGVDEPCLDDVLGRSRRRRGAAQRQPRGGGATCKPKRCVKTKLLVLTNRSKGGRTTTGSGFRTACPEKAGRPGAPCGEHAPVRGCSASHPRPFLRVAGDSSFTGGSPGEAPELRGGLVPHSRSPRPHAF